MVWEADFKLQAPLNNVEQNNILKGKEGMIDEIRSNSIMKIYYTIFFCDKACFILFWIYLTGKTVVAPWFLTVPYFSVNKELQKLIESH